MAAMTSNDRPQGLHPMWTSHAERAAAIADKAAELAGPDVPGENFLAKAARLNTAQHAAEEAILAEEQSHDQDEPEN